MKLQNRKTGEIATLTLSSNGEELLLMKNNEMVTRNVKLSDLEEWQDYEEEPCFISEFGKVYPMSCMGGDRQRVEWLKQIGNYFNTKEEAEKAVEKLKAWKRLKDNGFKFAYIRSIDGATIKHKDLDQYTIIAYADEDGCDQEYLNLLFGGEE